MKVQKSRKIDAKREAKSNHFSSKTRPWAKQGRLIHSLCLIFEGSKNRRFFDVDLEGDKNRQKSSLGAPRAENGATVLAKVVAEWTVSGLDGLRAAAKYQRITRKTG